MDIKAKIKQFIIENFQADDSLTDETPLLESDIIDSTGVMEIVFFVSDEFGVEIDAKDLVPANFNTINGMAAFLGKQMTPA